VVDQVVKNKDLTPSLYRDRGSGIGGRRQGSGIRVHRDRGSGVGVQKKGAIKPPFL